MCSIQLLVVHVISRLETWMENWAWSTTRECQRSTSQPTCKFSSTHWREEEGEREICISIDREFTNLSTKSRQRWNLFSDRMPALLYINIRTQNLLELVLHSFQVLKGPPQNVIIIRFLRSLTYSVSWISLPELFCECVNVLSFSWGKMYMWKWIGCMLYACALK